ncbi:MAG: HAD-IA family hydrolase [Candidatus Aenigmatarchaeota archaeon]
MKKIITDFNGIFLDSEFAKTLRWYLTACYFSKKYSPINKEFITNIYKGEGYEKLYREILQNPIHQKNLRYCFRFIGDPRGEFAKNVAKKFWKRKINSYELKEFIQFGSKLDNTLMGWFCRPIFNNLEFFYSFQKLVTKIYKEKNSIGIITMTTSKNFLSFINAGKKFWKNYEKFVKSFSSKDQKGKLKFVECGGDYPDDCKKSKTDKKSEIYKKLLKKLKIKPEETIVFEDTPSGCLAARKAGFPFVLGIINQKFYFQKHPYCSILIKRDLKKLRKYVRLFVLYSPEQVIKHLKSENLNL